MSKRPTYEEMAEKILALEREASKRNRTEELLRESEKKYRHVVENLTVGLLVVQDRESFLRIPQFQNIWAIPGKN